MKIRHWGNGQCGVDVNCVDMWDGKGAIDGACLLMRLKVNQNLNGVRWGNDSAETSGAKAACEIKLPAQSSFSARLQQRQVPAVGAGSLCRNQFRVLNNRKSGKNVFESGPGGGEGSVLCRFLPYPFSWFIFPAGEDPETRRLRTVKNIADLRQNLEETMSSLRGTQVTHR